MTAMNRRTFFKGPIASGLAGVALARPALASPRAERLLQLDNGFTVQVSEADYGYTTLWLMLRSHLNLARNGLSHLIEHTSFVGAAGEYSAHYIEEAWKEHVQDGNASTSPGRIVWTASFLPHHLEHVIELLALASLDQQFDVPTVAQEKKIVLQELYEEKFDGRRLGKRQFDQILYGKDHPLMHDTTEAEIRKAQSPADELALEMREFSKLLQLPANMNLYIVGSLGGHSSKLERFLARDFGRYERKGGPLLKMPKVPPTAGYQRLTRRSHDLQQPLCSMQIAWNTGVTINCAEAAALVLLAEYVHSTLFDRIREENGDAYSPEARFDLCDVAGMFDIHLMTTEDPRRIEKQVFTVLAEIKRGVGARELERLRERFELNRCRNRRQGDALMDNLLQRTCYGIATDDLDMQSVTPSDLKSVAERYMPDYQGAYLCMAEIGTG